MIYRIIIRVVLLNPLVLSYTFFKNSFEMF